MRFTTAARSCGKRGLESVRGRSAAADREKTRVADSVALLHNTRHETTRTNGDVLERCCSRATPDPSHGDAEERADGKELLERLHKGSSELEDGDDEQVDDEDPFPTVSIREQPAEKGKETDDQSKNYEREGQKTHMMTAPRDLNSNVRVMESVTS